MCLQWFPHPVCLFSSEFTAWAFTLIMHKSSLNATPILYVGTFCKCACVGVTTPSICNLTHRKPPPPPRKWEWSYKTAGWLEGDWRGGEGIKWHALDREPNSRRIQRGMKWESDWFKWVSLTWNEWVESLKKMTPSYNSWYLIVCSLFYAEALDCVILMIILLIRSRLLVWSIGIFTV